MCSRLPLPEVSDTTNTKLISNGTSARVKKHIDFEIAFPHGILPLRMELKKLKPYPVFTARDTQTCNIRIGALEHDMFEFKFYRRVYRMAIEKLVPFPIEYQCLTRDSQNTVHASQQIVIPSVTDIANYLFAEDECAMCPNIELKISYRLCSRVLNWVQNWLMATAYIKSLIDRTFASVLHDASQEHRICWEKHNGMCVLAPVVVSKFVEAIRGIYLVRYICNYSKVELDISRYCLVPPEFASSF